MHVLQADESNLNENDQARFFIYGGVIVETEQLPELHRRVAQIREQAGLASGDKLKFETRARPAHVDRETYTAAKSAVIDLCIELDLVFMAYLILHQIARNRDQAFRVEAGVNSLLLAFNNRFLRSKSSHGIVLVDRLPTDRPYDYLRAKFTEGLDSDDGWSAPLDRVVSYASTCDGASHLSSVVDIVLGAFRYCVNAPDPDVSTVRDMFPKVARLLWHNRIGDDLYVREFGLILRPRRVQVAMYQAEYDALIEKFKQMAPEVPD